jgi:hypothetical protein
MAFSSRLTLRRRLVIALKPTYGLLEPRNSDCIPKPEGGRMPEYPYGVRVAAARRAGLEGVEKDLPPLSTARVLLRVMLDTSVPADA